MPNNPDDAAILWDMLDAGRAILDFVKAKSPEDYHRDRMLRGAVERHVACLSDLVPPAE